MKTLAPSVHVPPLTHGFERHSSISTTEDVVIDRWAGGRSGGRSGGRAVGWSGGRAVGRSGGRADRLSGRQAIAHLLHVKQKEHVAEKTGRKY